MYALTAGVAGYVSAVQYKTMGGTNWVSPWLLFNTVTITASMVDVVSMLQHAFGKWFVYSVACC